MHGGEKREKMGNAYFHLNPRCVSAKVATFDPACVEQLVSALAIRPALKTKSSQRNYFKYVTMRKGWLQNKRVYKIDEKNVLKSVSVDFMSAIGLQGRGEELLKFLLGVSGLAIEHA